MSVPEPPNGESASPKPLDDSSPEEEPSNSAPGDWNTESDAADQSQVDGEQAPPSESQHISPANTDDPDASRGTDSRDGPPVNDPDGADTSTPDTWVTQSPAERRYGILTRSEIEALDIIPDANVQSFKPASYDLRLGRQWVHVGDRKKGGLEAQTSVSLEPFDRLYFETHEVVKLPLYVSGRFDLRMHFAIKGLFVQVGTQVDPGYKGKLFGLIINTSSDPVDVFADERLLTIEFHYLSGPVPDKDIPDPCYSLTAFLQSRSIGASKYTKASAIGAINHRVDDLSKELNDLTQKLQKELAEVHKGWKIANVLTATFITLLVLFVTVVISLLVWLVDPAVRQWVGEEARQQLLDRDTSNDDQGHGVGGRDSDEGDTSAGDTSDAELVDPDQGTDRTEGQRP